MSKKHRPDECKEESKQLHRQVRVENAITHRGISSGVDPLTN